jgi:uncharacterized phage protein gp47/JayE
MLARVRKKDPELDIREGSLVCTALAPAAAELQLMYIELDMILKESFADTQSRPFLARRAAERGIIAKDGTRALRLGEFDADVPIGSRFLHKSLSYQVIEKRDDGGYILECETAGSLGNLDFGELTPFSYIPGLSAARLGGVIGSGTDPESEEQLRRRYFQSMEALAFGGNAADYIQKVSALPGVGGVKVTGAWQGGGTVLLTIIGADMTPPPPGLTEQVQAAVDPAPGQGAGIAPVGHRVTVRGAAQTVISVTSRFTFAPDVTFQSLRPQLEREAGEYLAALRARWPDEDVTVVRVSGIEQRFLAVPGVVDMEGTRLNGTAGNIILPGDRLPVLGGITHV